MGELKRMKKKIISFFFFMLLVSSVSVNATNAFVEKNQLSEKDIYKSNEENDPIEKCVTLNRVTVMDQKNPDNENTVEPLFLSSGGPEWYSFQMKEWNELARCDDWGKIGKVNQKIFLYKLKYDESNKYDWYSIKWVIQSVPGIILWEGKDWRTDNIINQADVDANDSYIKLIDYDPYGNHGSTTVGISIGVTAGEEGAQVTCMLEWSYTKEDFMQYDLSDFSRELVQWIHDDSNDDLLQSITVEPGFTIQVPQGKDWTIAFRTNVNFHDPFPWNPDYYFKLFLSWYWENWFYNFKPDKPSAPSGTNDGYTDESYKFSVSTVDPDGDDLMYEFNWDDGTTTTRSWYNSGETVSAEHSWDAPGTYEIQVRAKDKHGEYSDWSHIHAVTIRDSCCFPAGTKITMADGSYKNIEDVKVGDRVLSYDVKKGRFTSWTVKMLGKPIHPVYEINDGLINATFDHPFYIRKSDGSTGWGAINVERTKNAVTYKKEILELEVGDKLFTSSGEWIEVTSIQPHDEPVQTYNILSFSGTKTYFANDILVYEEHPPGCIAKYFFNILTREIFPWNNIERTINKE